MHLSDIGDKKTDIIIMGLAIAAVIGLKVTQSPLFFMVIFICLEPNRSNGKSFSDVCACPISIMELEKKELGKFSSKASIDGPIVAE